MKFKLKFEISITQADVADYYGCSKNKARQAMDDIFPEDLIQEAVDNYEEEIREYIIEEIGNYIED